MFQTTNFLRSTMLANYLHLLPKSIASEMDGSIPRALGWSYSRQVPAANPLSPRAYPVAGMQSSMVGPECLCPLPTQFNFRIRSNSCCEIQVLPSGSGAVGLRSFAGREDGVASHGKPLKHIRKSCAIAPSRWTHPACEYQSRSAAPLFPPSLHCFANRQECSPFELVRSCAGGAE